MLLIIIIGKWSERKTQSWDKANRFLFAMGKGAFTDMFKEIFIEFLDQ